MFDKPALLILVIAIFVAAFWMTQPPISVRHMKSEWLKEKLDAHQRYTYPELIDDTAQARTGSVAAGDDAIRRLYRECGSY